MRTKARPARTPGIARARTRARRSARVLLLHACLGLLSATTAHAQAGGSTDEFEIPPAPGDAPPRLAFDVHTGFSAPLRNSSLCPKDVGCVLQSGGGVGGSAERRWPSGIGLMLAYDLWFLDTDSVYELGVGAGLARHDYAAIATLWEQWTGRPMSGIPAVSSATSTKESEQ